MTFIYCQTLSSCQAPTQLIHPNALQLLSLVSVLHFQLAHGVLVYSQGKRNVAPQAALT